MITEPQLGKTISTCLFAWVKCLRDSTKSEIGG